jgi:hypothetical protein
MKTNNPNTDTALPETRAALGTYTLEDRAQTGPLEFLFLGAV